jgi:hypothetical protein
MPFKSILHGGWRRAKSGCDEFRVFLRIKILDLPGKSAR